MQCVAVVAARAPLLQGRQFFLAVFLLDLTQTVSQSAIRLLTFVSPIPHLFHTKVSA